MSPSVGELRVLFRFMQEWRSLYEVEGIDEITSPSGRVWSLWDLEYLFRQAEKLLTKSQYTAIRLFLVEDHRERDAATMMGVSPTNPVGMYATSGLTKLIEFIEQGGVARFRDSRENWQHDHLHQGVAAMHALAGRIKGDTVRVLDGCLRYTLIKKGQQPRIRLGSRATASGFFYVHPLWVTYVAHRGIIPPGYAVAHRPAAGGYDPACVNHEHGILVKQQRRRAA